MYLRGDAHATIKMEDFIEKNERTTSRSYCTRKIFPTEPIDSFGEIASFLHGNKLAAKVKDWKQIHTHPLIQVMTIDGTGWRGNLLVIPMVALRQVILCGMVLDKSTGLVNFQLLTIPMFK
jgi:hypothetical protein